MRIDITTPSGNTMAALGIAANFLKQCGRRAEVAALRERVMSAKSVEEAREIITAATFGSIEFFDPDEE